MNRPSTSDCSFPEFIALMALLMAITALAIDMVLPALSVIGHEQGVADINHTQYVISVLFLGFTIGQLLYGPISDSFGRKPSIYLGLGIFIGGSALSYFSQSFEMMLLGRFLQGVGTASPRITSIAIIRDRFAGREMARVMSFVMAIFVFIPAIAPSLGELLMMVASWRLIFLAFILISLIAMAWAWKRLPETLHAEDRRPFSVKSVWEGVCVVVGNKITLGYTVCAGLTFSALVGYISCARQVFQDYFDTGQQFAFYFAVSALSIGAASVFNSMIVRKIGMQKICHYSLLMMTFTSAIFLVVVLAKPHDTTLLEFMIYTPVMFFCFGFLFGNLNALAMEPMGHLAGIASAVVGSFSSAISVVIGTMIGQAYNDTLIPLITGFLSLSVAVFLLQLKLGKIRKSATHQEAL